MAKNTPDPHAEIESASIEMNKLGIKLLPPDLAKSRMNFSIEGDHIRYGLDAIKGVAEKTKEAIIRFRGSKFLSKYDMFEIAKECKINIGVLSSLVFAGTLSSFGEDRGYLALEAQSYNLLTAREKRLFGMVGEEYNYDLLQSIHDVVSKQRVGDDGKPIMKKSRFETFKKKYNQYKEIYTKNKSHPKFANWFYERTLLGYSYSVKLSDAFEDGGIKSIPISKVEAAKNNTNVKFLGVVYDVVTGKSRAGNNYMRLSLIDETGKIDVMMCDNKYSKKFTDYKKSGLTIPEKDSIIYTSGSKSDDIVFINEMNVVSEMIYTKFSQLNGK
jgi:DNA polymerase-3 subunit alpha